MPHESYPSGAFFFPRSQKWLYRMSSCISYNKRRPRGPWSDDETGSGRLAKPLIRCLGTSNPASEQKKSPGSEAWLHRSDHSCGSCEAKAWFYSRVCDASGECEALSEYSQSEGRSKLNKAGYKFFVELTREQVSQLSSEEKRRKSNKTPPDIQFRNEGLYSRVLYFPSCTMSLPLVQTFLCATLHVWPHTLEKVELPISFVRRSFAYSSL